MPAKGISSHVLGPDRVAAPAGRTFVTFVCSHWTSYVRRARYRSSMKSHSLSHLTDPDLLAKAEQLAGIERRCAAELVLHIAEIEARQLHLAWAFPSMYVYCTEVLGLSDFEALARIEVARAGQRFPRMFDMLLDGSLSLTTAQL